MTKKLLTLAFATVGFVCICSCRGIDSPRPGSSEADLLSPIIGIEPCRELFRPRLEGSIAVAAERLAPSEKIEWLFPRLPDPEKKIFIEAAALLRQMEDVSALGPMDRRRTVVAFVDDSFEALDVCAGNEREFQSDMYAFASVIMAGLASDGSGFPDDVSIGSKFDEIDEPALRLILALVLEACGEPKKS